MGNPKKASASASATREVDAQLHNAARSGDLQSVQSILNSNPLAVNSRDNHSRTPLHLAAWSGQTEVVNYLCKNKADVGAAAMDDMGAVHFAAQKGHLEVVRILLLNGASVKASTRKGMTPLHYAAQGSHLDLVKYLVKKGSNLNARTKAGKTPLDLSTSEVIRLFLEEAEKLPKNGDTDVKEKETVVTEKNESRTDAVTNDAEEKDGDEKVKRKGDREDVEAPSEPKKPRVSLNHLLTMDDNQEDDDDII